MPPGDAIDSQIKIRGTVRLEEPSKQLEIGEL
jgi:hypothetical protein